MNAKTAAAHGHAAADAHHGTDEPHGSLRSYLIGFLLSVALTAVPFWLVMTGVIANHQVTAILILLLAIVQVVVHMIYFLHMNSKIEGGWSILALIFTVIVVVIALTGSLWVMYHLNANMMPPHDMNQLP